MTIRATRCVGNLKYMAVADSSEVKVGLAIHRKVETAVERKNGRASLDTPPFANYAKDGAPAFSFTFWVLRLCLQ